MSFSVANIIGNFDLYNLLCVCLLFTIEFVIYWVKGDIMSFMLTLWVCYLLKHETTTSEQYKQFIQGNQLLGMNIY